MDGTKDRRSIGVSLVLTLISLAGANSASHFSSK
jgi:hypothetical protein